MGQAVLMDQSKLPYDIKQQILEPDYLYKKVATLVLPTYVPS